MALSRTLHTLSITGGLPRPDASRVRGVDFREPWVDFVADAHRTRFEEELGRETAPSHVLSGAEVRAVARREDRDDVLFSLTDGRWAIVHLTWSGRRETEPHWPRTQLFETWEAVEAQLANDAAEYGE